MIKGRRSRAHADEELALVGEAEGYLKARTRYLEACREAETLRSAMPWLTTAQAEEVTHHYIQQRLRHTRLTLVRHIDELREQYETRYRQLRRDLLRTHAAVACVLVVGSAGINAAVCLLGR